MKPTPSAKAGLTVLVLGLAIFLAVAVWLKIVRRTLMDIPMPMHAGAVTKDFRIEYDGQMYVMAVQFDQSVSNDTARCLLGATKSERYPDLDCAKIAPLLKFSWELRCDGRVGGSGSSSEMGSVSRARGGPRVMIVGFPASKKHRYEAMLKFDRNADDLTVSPPRVQIEPDAFAREGFIIEGLILDVMGFGLCLIGAAMVVFPLLRAKFVRFNSLPEPR